MREKNRAGQDITEKMVIWPAYLAAGRTRREGRIVPLRYAVKAPKLEEIEKVARALNLEPVVEREKAYPRTHWEKSGRILVAKRGPKGTILKELARGIRELREKTAGMRR